MTTIEERKLAAVVGALVADAAAQPLHWLYKTEVLDALLDGEKEVAFWKESLNPFYTIDTGNFSCYGDQSYIILKSLVEKNGLDVEDLKKSTYQKFGPKSPYDTQANVLYKDKSAAEKKELPIKGPWRHGNIKEFLRNVQEGKEETGSETDESIDCVLRVVPVAAWYAGCPDMLEKAEAVVRMTQNTDICVVTALTAARLLEYYILSGSKSDGIEHVINLMSDSKREHATALDEAMINYLRQVLNHRNAAHVPTARSSFKISCGVPGNFQSALHCVMKSTSYSEGVQMTIRAGGCNCSRGGFIGACLAAQNGLSDIPEPWKQKTHLYEEILSLGKQLANANL